MLKSWIVFTAFVCSSPSLAAIDSKSIKTFKTEKSIVKTFVPNDWQAIPNNITVPLSLLSKKGAQGKRAVIQVVPYNRVDKDDALFKIDRDSENFYAQKEEWLNSVNGASISYVPLKEKTIGGTKITSIGIKYKNMFGEFLDQTFYISSKTKHIFYVKAVVPLDLLETEYANVDKVIETIAEQN